MFLKDKNKQSKNISDKISGVIFTILVWSLNGAGVVTELVINMRDDSPCLLSDIRITMTNILQLQISLGIKSYMFYCSTTCHNSS